MSKTPWIRAIKYLTFLGKKNPHLRTSLERGRGGERERERIDVRGKHPAGCLPWLPIQPATRHVPCPGIELATFSARDDTPSTEPLWPGKHLTLKN